MLKVHLLLISGNETEKDRGDRHAPQNLTADHLTGVNFTGGHQNVNQLTAGYMIGVPNLGGRLNVNQLTAGYMTGLPNLGGRQNGYSIFCWRTRPWNISECRKFV